MTELQFDKLHSATKYPSIETYHRLGERGLLREDEAAVFPEGPVILTEKVNGGNGRIILLPGEDDFFIGSREEILYAAGDRIINPAGGFVSTLKPVAERLLNEIAPASDILVLYLEVYGHSSVNGWRNYARAGTAPGYRLFDASYVPAEALTWEPERIVSWRERGGQSFLSEEFLQELSDAARLRLVPRLGTVPASSLPRSVEEMHLFLTFYAPETQVRLIEPDGNLYPAEGIVLRSPDRSCIRKARFDQYERTLRAAAESNTSSQTRGGRGKG